MLCIYDYVVNNWQMCNIYTLVALYICRSAHQTEMDITTYIQPGAHRFKISNVVAAGWQYSCKMTQVPAMLPYKNITSMQPVGKPVKLRSLLQRDSLQVGWTLQIGSDSSHLLTSVRVGPWLFGTRLPPSRWTVKPPCNRKWSPRGCRCLHVQPSGNRLSTAATYNRSPNVNMQLFTRQTSNSSQSRGGYCPVFTVGLCAPPWVSFNCGNLWTVFNTIIKTPTEGRTAFQRPGESRYTEAFLMTHGGYQHLINVIIFLFQCMWLQVLLDLCDSVAPQKYTVPCKISFSFILPLHELFM